MVKCANTWKAETGFLYMDAAWAQRAMQYGTIKAVYQHIYYRRWLYIVFVVGPRERGDDYSEAKIITELCALAHSSVASQYITRFPVAVPTICRFHHLVSP